MIVARNMVKLDGLRTTTIHANGNKCLDESVTYINQKNGRELAMQGKCRRSECGPLENQILGDRSAKHGQAGQASRQQQFKTNAKNHF